MASSSIHLAGTGRLAREAPLLMMEPVKRELLDQSIMNVEIFISQKYYVY
jgi:hypothetical protein